MKALLKIVPMMIILLSFWLVAFANDKVHGKVVDAHNAPISGAKVHVEGTDLETHTDEKGMFELTVHDHEKIMVTADGFDPKEVEIHESDHDHEMVIQLHDH